MYFLKVLSNFIEKSLKRRVKNAVENVSLMQTSISLK